MAKDGEGLGAHIHLANRITVSRDLAAAASARESLANRFFSVAEDGTTFGLRRFAVYRDISNLLCSSFKGNLSQSGLREAKLSDGQMQNLASSPAR